MVDQHRRPGDRRAGEGQALAASSFADVYAEHRDRILRLAYLLCGDRHLAEDLAADAFANTWKRWERGEVDDVGAYLRRAVVNQRNSWWRRRSMHRDRVEDRRTGDARGERTHEERTADRDALWQALQRLPQRERQVLVLRYWEELSIAEIAAALDVSEGTVKSQLSRGTARLRDHHQGVVR